MLANEFPERVACWTAWLARDIKETHGMNGIPVLVVEGDCIARAWENSLVKLYQEGCEISTQYDRPGDPPSKDATMLITVTDPLQGADDPSRHAGWF